ncbi:hypothetical protein YB2330_000972 [Saitoella coloradoensis]
MGFFNKREFVGGTAADNASIISYQSIEKNPSPPMSATRTSFARRSTSSAHSVNSKRSPSILSTTMSFFSTLSAPATAPAQPNASVKGVKLPAPPNADEDPSGYLRTLNAVRERSNVIFEKGKQGELKCFDLDMGKMDDVIGFVASIIKRDYAPDYHLIPPHGRWQHFEVGGSKRIDRLLAAFPPSIDDFEKTRRLLDLFVVSVLLDAGAGTKWTYKEEASHEIYRRSEGLAVASLEMFNRGRFTGDIINPWRVDAEGLSLMTAEILGEDMQVSEDNPLAGLEGRTELLNNLGKALRAKPEYFGKDARPGNILDYLLKHPTTLGAGTPTPTVLVPTLWAALMHGFAPIWPAGRTTLSGDSTQLGDAWPTQLLPQSPPHAKIVPFHKLTQWMAYSLIPPMTRLAGIRFAGMHLFTGLPEYRNGGLFIDLGLLTLKKEVEARGLATYHATVTSDKKIEVVPMYAPGDEVIVEWRACTVALLDLVAEGVNKKLGLRADKALSLAQVLEAGTWKSGRELAEIQRPNTKGPPIGLLSDGTVF